MTTGTERSTPEELARKAVRARRLTDPLGAMGHRTPGQRIEREARTRRAMFAGAMAAFVAAFGLVSMSAPPPEPAAVAAPVAPMAAPSAPVENAVVAFEPRQEAFVPAEPQVRPERTRASRPVHARTQSS